MIPICPGVRPVLRWLDASACAEHVLLEDTDRCGYLLDYRSDLEFAATSGHRLMWHFKSLPSRTALDPEVSRRKERALGVLADWLRQAIARQLAESWTWVPVPPSRHHSDPDFDDRLARLLARAFAGYDLDQRCLLQQTASTAPDHRSRRRVSQERLFALLRVDQEALRRAPLREGIMLFDDVITSGKHFRCCERRIRQQCPMLPVHGIFLMRRLPPRSARALGQAW